MDISNNANVIAMANSYNQKYYLKPELENLPRQIRNEIKAMCVGFVSKMGGSISLELCRGDETYDEELVFRTFAIESDFYYDEIGVGLKIKELKRENAELLEQLLTYLKYKDKLS